MSSRTNSLTDVVQQILTRRETLPPIRATYRLQFNHQFTFEAATALVPYLADLGISHLYASPIFMAAPGSMHGYDVVDYNQLNPELGSRQDFDRLVRTLHQHGMGLVVDFVPNHMGIERGANPWWQDLLQHGRMSRYADYFDIDWSPPKRELYGRVLLPVLGGQYGQVLENGELLLLYEDGDFLVQYWDTPFPIDPATYPHILKRVQAHINGLLAPDDLDGLELESIVAAFERLPVVQHEDPNTVDIKARFREHRVTSRRLAELIDRNCTISAALADIVSSLNGRVGEPETFDALDDLLDRQNYRLSYWRVASEEINYRRFFAINTLAAIRQEDPAVFAATHQLLFDLICDGSIDGVRFDHPDGLWDPERYFDNVQEGFLREAVKREIRPESDEAWLEILPDVNHEIQMALQRIADGNRRWPLWTVVEKILEHDETLPTTWKVAGTVGYEFMRAATGLLVNSESRPQLDTIYGRYTGEKLRFPELVYDMKLQQVRESFASELNVLTGVASRISEGDRHSRDFTFNSLRKALRELLAAFGVYRTYTTCRDPEVSHRDAAIINAAVDEAIRRNPQMDASVFEFLRNALMLHHTGETQERKHAPCHFAMKLQQLSGPVMAKGLEDTAFYRFNRLTSLNEVGGDPARYGVTETEFHRHNQERARVWPQSMINSSTHDTKRSEDVRAAISVLSERPTEWRAALNRWTRLNRKFMVKPNGMLLPVRADTWLFYQSLVGTWPLKGSPAIDEAYVSRLQEYMIKSVREAARFSNWINPDEQYESALKDFIAGALNKRRNRSFLAEMDTFVREQRDAAFANSLSQQVMKLTSPGVPDIYQGTELWDDSLVDPDNRRPVDYSLRASLISQQPSLAELEESRLNGGIKLKITQRILQFRRDHRELFAEGTYTPVRTGTEFAIAWLREYDEQKLLVVVPRLLYTLARQDVFANPTIWQGITLHLPADLPKTGWYDILAQTSILNNIADLESLFTHLPLAVLAWNGESE